MIKCLCVFVCRPRIRLSRLAWSMASCYRAAPVETQREKEMKDRRESFTATASLTILTYLILISPSNLFLFPSSHPHSLFAQFSFQAVHHKGQGSVLIVCLLIGAESFQNVTMLNWKCWGRLAGYRAEELGQNMKQMNRPTQSPLRAGSCSVFGGSCVCRRRRVRCTHSDSRHDLRLKDLRLKGNVWWAPLLSCVLELLPALYDVEFPILKNRMHRPLLPFMRHSEEALYQNLRKRVTPWMTDKWSVVTECHCWRRLRRVFFKSLDQYP